MLPNSQFPDWTRARARTRTRTSSDYRVVEQGQGRPDLYTRPRTVRGFGVELREMGGYEGLPTKEVVMGSREKRRKRSTKKIWKEKLAKRKQELLGGTEESHHGETV